MKTQKPPHPVNKLPEQYGYAGLRQPSRNVTVKISTPETVDLKLVDLWLEKLKIPLPDDLVSNSQTIKDTSLALASRMLLIATQLQHGNKIPIFEEGRILAIEPDKDHASAEVTLQSPVMDYFPLQADSIIYRGAINIVYWSANNIFNNKNLQILYKNIETSILEPLKKVISGGKSTIPILESAFDLNIPFRHVGANHYQLGWGKHAQLFYLSSTSKDSAIGVRLSDSKATSARFLKAAGLPAPEHFLVQTKEQAISAAQNIGWPVVVKPNDLERGEGVTIDIASEVELVSAFEKAVKLSKNILVERQVPGTCYRFTVSNGKLIYAIRRDPISVTGNGKNNVGELIREANRAEQAKPPWDKRRFYPSDKLALEAIAAAGFSLDAVPEEGEYVPLRIIESTADGGTPIDATDLVHPENQEIAIKAAKLFRLYNAGVDIISDDISKPWYENGAAINEVNFQPALGSATAKKAMPAFLAQVIQDDGRIPIDVIVGGNNALEFGEKLQLEQIDKGISCFLASETIGRTNKKQPIKSWRGRLFNNVLALLMDKDVESLVVVIQTDDFLDTGLPFDKVSKLYISPEPVKSGNADGEDASKERKEQLVSLIKNYATQEPVLIAHNPEAADR